MPCGIDDAERLVQVELGSVTSDCPADRQLDCVARRGSMITTDLFSELLPQVPNIRRVHHPLELRSGISNLGKTIIHQRLEDRFAVDRHFRLRGCSIDVCEDFTWRRKQFAATATHNRIDGAVAPLDGCFVRHGSGLPPDRRGSGENGELNPGLVDAQFWGPGHPRWWRWTEMMAKRWSATVLEIG